jgi:hypothetical protein
MGLLDRFRARQLVMAFDDGPRIVDELYERR